MRSSTSSWTTSIPVIEAVQKEVDDIEDQRFEQNPSFYRGKSAVLVASRDYCAFVRLSCRWSMYASRLEHAEGLAD